jgi:hypothetical protein
VKWQVFRIGSVSVSDWNCDDLHGLTRGQYVPFSGTCFHSFGKEKMPVDIVALIVALASIFGGGTVTPDGNPKISVSSVEKHES